MTTTRQTALSPGRLREEWDRPLAVARLGTMPYLDAWALQQRLVAHRQRGQGRDALLLLEHPPVYTLGKRTNRDHLLFDDAQRTAAGIDLVEVDRGGDITYHGPGQLVGYPILRLASIRAVVDYVRALEEVLIRALSSFGIRAQRSEGFTGVWVGERKIAAIGVRVASGGVTSHGFALNVTTDLTHFDGIVPCGIPDRGVCSLTSLGVDTDIDTVATEVERMAGERFGATLEPVPTAALDPSMEY